MRKRVIGMAVLTVGVLVGGVVGAEKLSIEQVMKKSMKGDHSLYKKLINGQASAAEKQQFLTYVKMLEGTKPPKGSQDEWNGRITKLVTATENAVANKPGAVATLKDAANCKACHKVHQDD